MRILGYIVKTPRLCPENPRHFAGYVLGAGLTGVPGARGDRSASRSAPLLRLER